MGPPIGRPKLLNMTTIYTDASFDKGVGGGAYWITFNLQGQGTQRIRESFKMTNVRGINEAELYTIVRAIGRACVANPQERYFQVYTDSQNAILVIEGRERTKLSQFKRLKQYIQDRDLVIVPKKVKAHRKDNSNVAFINGWCDYAAGKQRRKGSHPFYVEYLYAVFQRHRSQGRFAEAQKVKEQIQRIKSRNPKLK